MKTKQTVFKVEKKAAASRGVFCTKHMSMNERHKEQKTNKQLTTTSIKAVALDSCLLRQRACFKGGGDVVNI